MEAVIKAFEESSVVIDIEQYTMCLLRQLHPDWSSDIVMENTKKLLVQAENIIDIRKKQKLITVTKQNDEPKSSYVILPTIQEDIIDIYHPRNRCQNSCADTRNHYNKMLAQRRQFYKLKCFGNQR